MDPMTIIGEVHWMARKTLQAIFSCYTFDSRVLSWTSKTKQDILAQSITDAEFTVVTAVMWMRKILNDLQVVQIDSSKVLVNNQVANSNCHIQLSFPWKD